MIIYLLYNNFHFFTYFWEVGQKYRNIFVHFLVQMKTSKSHSEINWPLATVLHCMLSILIAVPKWIFEGRCNMGILMQTASEVATEVDVNRVEYFPHNDTLHTIYRCGQDSKDSTTRIRTCTFSNNVGSQF